MKNRRKKFAVLLIDDQNDFCSTKGSLYVPGAEKDNERLGKWIKNNGDHIDHISFTLDTHAVNDISHPTLWRDKHGNMPKPFTAILHHMILSGEYTPVAFVREITEYVRRLEEIAAEEVKQGIPFPIPVHLIWPIHCVAGSEGAALDPVISEALAHWSTLNPYNIPLPTVKGDYPLSEHFGAFEAQVPDINYPETTMNQGLVKTLEEYDKVIFAGQAKSHCVATTLKQAIFKAPTLASKFIILEDCMSSVPNGPAAGVTFEELAQPIYDLAKQKGIYFTNTKDLVLSQVGSLANAVI